MQCQITWRGPKPQKQFLASLSISRLSTVLLVIQPRCHICRPNVVQSQIISVDLRGGALPGKFWLTTCGRPASPPGSRGWTDWGCYLVHIIAINEDPKRQHQFKFLGRWGSFQFLCVGGILMIWAYFPNRRKIVFVNTFLSERFFVNLAGDAFYNNVPEIFGRGIVSALEVGL